MNKFNLWVSNLVILHMHWSNLVRIRQHIFTEK
ncbi:hypothetical protein Gogos_012860 [Gossypium gossypioides]|uniref:Uncharacterized protein n=1 Tax=Gossypium gossypioides TaxID=34282 RepID=A0A7J9BU45_GOSGO|nr:hypothetical protein [Gossypium gossypioides]